MPENLNILIEQCRKNLINAKTMTHGLSDEQSDLLINRYSFFNDVNDADGMLINSSIVIKELHTPRPYLHMMASNHQRNRDQWGSFWDQYRGGFSCVDSVLAGKMSSHTDSNYVPTAPTKQDVRDFFIYEQGKSWPMYPIPHFEEDTYTSFECRQGLDWFKLAAIRNELSCTLLVQVHSDLPVEIWKINISNDSNRKRQLSWFLRLPVCVDSYPFYYFVPRVVCEGLMEDGTMVFINHDKNNTHKRAAFLLSAESFDGYDMMAELFDGSGGRSPIPKAVAQGACTNSLGQQPYSGLVAAAQFNAFLGPKESRTWTIVFGKCPYDANERKLFLDQVRQSLLKDSSCLAVTNQEPWKDKIYANVIKTPDNALDRYYNIWSKYQIRNQVRFVRALDKVGYRDVLQDIAGACDAEPDFVRDQLLMSLQYQYPDGTALRQYEKFEGGGHDLRRYKDSAFWIIYALDAYLKETGNLGLLNVQVPFYSSKTLKPDSNDTGSVYDHAKIALQSLFSDVGYHGLCRIGYGDWNDSLSGLGGGDAVSVWLSCACVYGAKLLSELANVIGRIEDKKEFDCIAETMTERINVHAWDGKWYVYAFNCHGKPVGSKTNAEGKMHLNVNTWAIFTGIAQAASREKYVLESLCQLATPVGHRLLAPAYTNASQEEVGRIANILPGMFENGSIYTHGESFYLYALLSLGRGDEFYAELKKTLPANLVPDIVTGPPHQQSNFFVGPEHASYGANLFSGFTGSLSWYRQCITRMIGVIPDYNGLLINPLPPRHWNEYAAKRQFRGAKLKIIFHRGDQQSVSINGNALDGNFISVSQLDKDKTYNIEVSYV